MHAIGLIASLLPLPYIFSNHYSGRMEKIPRTYLWPTPKANLEIVTNIVTNSLGGVVGIGVDPEINVRHS